MVGRKVQDHTAGPLGMPDTTAQTLQLNRRLTGRRHLIKTMRNAEGPCSECRDTGKI